MRWLDYLRDIKNKRNVPVYKLVLGAIKISFDRQRAYFSALTPILVGGLYFQGVKNWIIHVIEKYNYWLIPAFFAFILFDLFVILPGERTFGDSQSGVLKEILKQNGGRDG